MDWLIVILYIGGGLLGTAISLFVIGFVGFFVFLCLVAGWAAAAGLTNSD